MTVSLDDCKRFAGIVGHDDDIVMQLCMESAMEYIADSGVPESARESSRYALCTYMLAAHYYDHRSEIAEGTNAVAVPSGVVTLILQLKAGKKEAQAYGAT